MANKTFKSVYNSSPQFVKECIHFPYRRFYIPFLSGGVHYLRWNRFLNKSEFWKKEKLEEYQIKNLKHLLGYSYRNVPYYHNLFKKIGFDVQKVKNVSDLERIPLLTKDIVKKNVNDFIAKNVDLKSIHKVSTSGTTGRPLMLYETDSSYKLYLAILRRMKNNLGIKVCEKQIHVYAEKFLENPSNNKKLFIEDPLIRTLYLSSFRLTKGNVRVYLNKILKFKPVYGHGNPSTISFLANSSKELNIHMQMRYFISAVEKLLPAQREVIDNNLRCETYDFYSSAEHVTSACECEEHKGLHVQMEQGILEITDHNRKQTSKGEKGMIIATGLHNYAMPLIRYTLEDEGIISEEKCPCGRETPLLKEITGRTTENLHYNGRTINAATLSLAFLNMEDIIESQLIQPNQKTLIVKTVRNENTKQDNTTRLIKNLQILTGKNIRIKIQNVKKIPRTKKGKYQFIKSSLKD